jgi:spermidine synthase
MKKTLSALIYFTVFSTGLFSLVYQTVWQRYLTFLVGADSRSSILTLTVFLTALSIGYYLAGRISDKIKNKELYYYGLIEFVIGLWAVVFPWLFKFSFSLVETGIVNAIWGDILLSVLLTAIPATLMGTTLPFLTQGLSQSFSSSSKTHAAIYAINTIGACFGALLAGFLLVELIGLAACMYFIGAFNMFFGLLMMVINRFHTKKANHSEVTKQNIASEGASTSQINQFSVLIVAACSGYLLIAIESYFIRLFSIATDGSNFAYPTVVTAFIAAVGIGAALSAKLMNKAFKFYAYIPLLVMFLWIVVYFTIPQWPYADYLLKHWFVVQSDHFNYLPIFRFGLLFVVIGLPVITSSMLLPFSFHLYKNKDTNIGKTTGNLYAVATIATIFGGLIGGYLAFNYLDFQQVFLTYFIIMAIMVIAAIRVVKSSVRQYTKTIAILVGFFMVLMIFPAKDFNKNLALTYYFQTPVFSDSAQPDATVARDWLWKWFDYEEIISSSIRAEGIVSVFNKNNIGNTPSRMIAINGRSNSGTTGTDYQGNALLSLFPYLMTESPKRILVIGLGTGVTAGAIAAQNEVVKVDVCEINAAVSDQLPLFDFATFDASTNPKINIMQTDVVKYLLRTKDEYDIIVSIPSNFWTAGIENLMMPEFYNIAQSKLAKGGTFIQWIPDYDFSEMGLLTLIKSFTTSFEDSSLWRLTRDDLVLMYRKEHNKTKPWINQRLYDGRFLDIMDAIKFPNPNQLKLGQLADHLSLKRLAVLGKTHSLDEPSLGKIALNALYQPEETYSAEKTINSLQ